MVCIFPFTAKCEHYLRLHACNSCFRNPGLKTPAMYISRRIILTLFGLSVSALRHANSAPLEPLESDDTIIELSFELISDGTASAGIFNASSGVMVSRLFSGLHFSAGKHAITINATLLPNDTLSKRHLELRVVSAPHAKVKYVWEGVLGNTGPLTGPGALKGLNPPRKIQVVGEQAVWCLGYNERQPGCFVFNLSNPQVSVPVSPANFERNFNDLSFDGRIAYLPNSGNTPESNNYYHLPETFVVAFDLTKTAAKYSPRAPYNKTQQFCMHNFTAPGVQTEVCTTGTSQPKPPWKCKTDGCVSTSKPPTWLALDFTHLNVTVPAGCNSNRSWSGRCHYTSEPSGIAVQCKGNLLLVSHAYADTPSIKLFDKVTGAHRGLLVLREQPGRLAIAADEKSVWVLLGDGQIKRYAVPSGKFLTSTPTPLASVEGVDTACELAVHPTTNELWVLERKSQAILRFPAEGGSIGKAWGKNLNLSFPYISTSPNGAGFGTADMVCASASFTDDGLEIWLTDPGSRRIIRVDVATEVIKDRIMFLTVQYTAAADWTNPTRVFSNFLEFEVDYDVPLTPHSGWKLKRNWGTGLPAMYHAQIGLTHWSFAGFESVVTTVDNHTLAKTNISPNDLDPDPANDEIGEATLFVEMMHNGTLRPLVKFRHGFNVDLLPDASLRAVIFDRKTNYTWVGMAPWDPATLNWSLPFTTMVNVSESRIKLSPHFSGGQGGKAPIHDVDDPDRPGSKLLMILEGGNSPTYRRNHLGAIRWTPSAVTSNEVSAAEDEWVWTASPGGNWSDPIGAHKVKCNVSMDNNGSHSMVFEDTCIVDPDGSLDRCGGHFPCAANVALTSGQDVIYGFNGEGWDGGQANQWLHFDALSGLFIGQFGTVNGIHDRRYTDAGWAAPGAAGNAFSSTLVTTSTGVYLYHNDESVHGGVHRWKIQGLKDIQRLRIPLISTDALRRTRT